MRKALLLLGGLLIQALGSQAQAVNCGLAIAKSGTGSVKTYTLSVPSTVPVYTFNIYPSTGVTVTTNGLVKTATFAYGGVYSLYMDAPNYCTDSIWIQDTVVGPMNCAVTNTWLSASVNSSTGVATFTNSIGSPLLPGYTATVNYQYGDGTSGTSATHAYTTSGGYVTATAITTYSHAQYGSCNDTATASFYVPLPPCTLTFSKSGTGLTRTYTFSSNAVSPNYHGSLWSDTSLSGAGGGYLASFYINPYTYTYSQPGYYRVGVSVNGQNCTDSVNFIDTVVGAVNCATLTHSMYASGSLGSYTFYRNGTATASYPGYTSTTTYNYGDGSTGTATNHTYAASGTYVVTANTMFSHPTYGNCTSTATTTVTNTLPPNVITASAVWDSTINAAGASVKIWLIQYDSTAQTLSAVDSALIPAQANIPYVSHDFVNKPAGSYRVKAHMINQPAAWTTGFLPTYATNAAYWNNATVINHIGTTTYSNVWFQQGTPMTGPGFIGGSITQGANKGTAVGDPMGNITVLLRNSGNNNLVASTQTDANGSFTFFNVPLGSYNVYPEELNYATTPSAAIQVTASNTTHAGNDFLREVVAKHLHPANLSVMQRATGAISISPNPAKERLTIQFATAPAKGTMIQLYNLSGQRVKTMEITNAQAVQQLDLNGLAAGNYLLHVPAGKETKVYQISVQP